MLQVSYLDFARIWLDLRVADSFILIFDHGPATVTLAHTRPSVVFAEESLGIGHEELYLELHPQW